MRHLHLGGQSGTLAAATSGIIFGWRAQASWQYIQRFRAVLTPITPPAAVAFAGIELALNAGLTANYSGGTDLSDFGGAGAANYGISSRIRDTARVRQADQLLSASAPSLAAAGNIVIATTAALAGGAGTVAAQPWAATSAVYPAAATAQFCPPLVLEWKNPSQGLEHEDPLQGCIQLAPDTGFVIRLSVALAAGFAAELSFDADFLE